MPVCIHYPEKLNHASQNFYFFWHGFCELINTKYLCLFVFKKNIFLLSGTKLL